MKSILDFSLKVEALFTTFISRSAQLSSSYSNVFRNNFNAFNEPFRLALGKNFASSAHVDDDLGYTFSGSFSTEQGKQGNGFVFPAYQLRLSFPDDVNKVNFFCFNPKESH